MIFDHMTSHECSSDQAAGLRQLRRTDSTTHAPVRLSERVLTWPRVVLISEFPGTDIGARFAFHLACVLGQPSADGRSPKLGTHSRSNNFRNLLVDLAPAASRLPYVLSDCVPIDMHPPLWRSLSIGRPLSVVDLRQQYPLAVAAESHTVPCAIDQIPRLYEQLVRQLSRQGERYRWIVLLALDNIVPLDRACWQAADDVVLLTDSGPGDSHRQMAALRSRIDGPDAERTLWTLPKRPYSWRSALSHGHDDAKVTACCENDLQVNRLSPVMWPRPSAIVARHVGYRTDVRLLQSARRVADQLRLAAACQTSGDLAENNGAQKKIQLSAGHQPISNVTEDFRA